MTQENQNQPIQVLYRGKGVSTAIWDKWDETVIDRVGHRIFQDEFAVLSETDKGYWIEYPLNPSGKKWVSKTSRKRFAHDTVEGSLDSYIHRAKRANSIMRARIYENEKCITAAREELANYKTGVK